MRIERVKEVKDFKIFEINRYIVIALLILSFSFAGAYEAQTSLMVAPSTLSDIGFSYAITPLFAYTFFVVSGTISFLVFELFLRLFLRMLNNTLTAELHLFSTPPMSHNDKRFRQITRCFMIPANVLLGLIHIIYFYYPLAITFISIVVDFLIVGFALTMCFMYYRRHISKHLHGKAFMLASSLYLGFHGVMIAINIIYALLF